MFTFKFPSLFFLSIFPPTNFNSPPPLNLPFEKEEKKKNNVCLVVPRKSSLIYFEC